MVRMRRCPFDRSDASLMYVHAPSEDEAEDYDEDEAAEYEALMRQVRGEE